jgi:hypothetical protein
LAAICLVLSLEITLFIPIFLAEDWNMLISSIQLEKLAIFLQAPFHFIYTCLHQKLQYLAEFAESLGFGRLSKMQ